MTSDVRDRWITALGVVVLAGALGAGVTECVAQTSGRMSTQSVNDLMSDLDQDPDRVVRVIVTVKPGSARQVGIAATNAGANAVNPLFGTDSIVIEGKAAHIRAAVNTGDVLQLQRDSASPTN